MAESRRQGQTASKNSNRSHTGTMSRSEAGRAGGLAPHRCRGRECDESSSKSRNESSSSRSYRGEGLSSW